MIYIKFKYDINKGVLTKKESIFLRIIEKILTSIIPISNPDFTDKIDKVLEWFIEYDENENFIERELGLDQNNNVILKMPYKNNYGFWLDTNMRLEDFKEKFNIEVISENEFSKKWDELV